jgi:hypothetical protein
VVDAEKPRATNISFLHTSKLTDGTTGMPGKTGLTACRNQMFVARALRHQLPASVMGFPPLLLRSLVIPDCMISPSLTVFDIKGVPGHRRGRIESAVVAGRQERACAA